MRMPVLSAVAPPASHISGQKILFVVVLVLAALWFIFEMFKREIGGLGGGSEKNLVGVLVLIAAIIVGILLGKGKLSAQGHTQQTAVTHVAPTVRQHNPPVTHAQPGK